jgi:hypothetical protein
VIYTHVYLTHILQVIWAERTLARFRFTMVCRLTEERIGRVKKTGQFPSLIIAFPVFFLHQGKLFAETSLPRLRPPPR